MYDAIQKWSCKASCKRPLFLIMKDDKITNRISGNDCHECPFYDALDSWWHQSGNVMEHVNASINEIDEIVNNLKFQTNLDNGSRGDVNTKPLDIPITLNEVTKQKTIGRRSMSLNIFQLWQKIIQQCYNNLQKPTFY